MLLDQRKKISNRTQIKYEIQIVFWGKGSMKLYYKWIGISVELTKNISFADDLLHSIHILKGFFFWALFILNNNLRFFYYFHSKKHTRSLSSCQNYPSKSTFSNFFYQLKIFYCVVSIFLFRVLFVKLFFCVAFFYKYYF